ncbi:DNA polymerase III subunit chi [Pontixanthobacter aestiaquae]|uniref:DNA polymerase III subunit chi n=1 Tax=Pontixanthobacter aestiaquae TaxID=1509367 RepID=A0A844Z8H5_9SPHN|nr:DNA polymerase III subunit chi [Pontixanthobacter aestiaquae]MDN3644881.1 DNA polymerase III subunit chi [Pontixanthobacter aestiaquae]MXO84118.1 DNA polymerase III subunit chi [Pontixanthobacter aestiaquae]
MRVDFYQLSRDPAELVVPLLARATKMAGEKLLVVSDDGEQLDRIDKQLWEAAPEAFLAHGKAGEAHEARQPVLLSNAMSAPNAAKYVVLADGQWRDDTDGFDRAFLLFGDDRLQEARACWKSLGDVEGMERNFWKQEGGKWAQMA